jgi:hypothetical protein
VPRPHVTARAAVVAAGVVGALVLAGCSSTEPDGGGSSATTLDAFSQPAAQALVTQAEVQQIAGNGMQAYRSETVVAAADPLPCLELIRVADGTRTGPGSTQSSATVSFADGSTGASITNTAHVFADAAAATTTFKRLVGEVASCGSFTIKVGDQAFRAGVTRLRDAPGGESSMTVRITVTSPSTSSDVTSVLARTNRTIVVAAAGTPDGTDEQAWATRTAVVSVGKAESI